MTWFDDGLTYGMLKKNGPLGYFGTGGAIYCHGNSGLVLVWKRLRIVAMHNLKFLLKISYVDWATMDLWTYGEISHLERLEKN